MSYNLFCETNQTIPWDELNYRVCPFTTVEYLPMPSLGIDGGDAIGLSIPLKNVGARAGREIETVINILKRHFGLTIYDMYSGDIISAENLYRIKNEIT